MKSSLCSTGTVSNDKGLAMIVFVNNDVHTNATPTITYLTDTNFIEFLILKYKSPIHDSRIKQQSSTF